MYKPGQIVTINHRRYRIKRSSKHPRYSCWECIYEHLIADREPCCFCLCHLDRPDLYLEPIEAQIQIRKRLCGNQDK